MIKNTFIHGSAIVSEKAQIGKGVQIWVGCQIREDAIVGDNCILGKNVYIDANVVIGRNVKIQNNVSIFQGVTIEDGVFIGPHVCFTNDKIPRSINPNGTLKSSKDWVISKTRIGSGASLGANSTILCGIEVGPWSMVGSGAVVTKNVPAFGLVIGNPAKLIGFICFCGEKLHDVGKSRKKQCLNCSLEVPISETRSDLDFYLLFYNNWRDIIFFHNSPT